MFDKLAFLPYLLSPPFLQTSICRSGRGVVQRVEQHEQQSFVANISSHKCGQTRTHSRQGLKALPNYSAHLSESLHRKNKWWGDAGSSRRDSDRATAASPPLAVMHVLLYSDACFCVCLCLHSFIFVPSPGDYRDGRRDGGTVLSNVLSLFWQDDQRCGWKGMMTLSKGSDSIPGCWTGTLLTKWDFRTRLVENIFHLSTYWLWTRIITKKSKLHLESIQMFYFEVLTLYCPSCLIW